MSNFSNSGNYINMYCFINKCNISMWATSATKVNLLMRIISVTIAVIRNKRKRIHEGLKISLMREISATSIVLMLMVISGKKKCLSNKGNKGNVSY